jgi:hypothetical protein
LRFLDRFRRKVGVESGLNHGLVGSHLEINGSNCHESMLANRPGAGNPKGLLGAMKI